MARKQTDYFKMFVDLVDYSCSAAKMLYNVISKYDEKQLAKRLEEIHNIEHSADIAKHNMMRLLVKEFITPIDREDIIQLSQEIDDVTDSIEDVMLRLYMFNITTIRDDALLFAEKIVEACNALKKAMEEFHNFKKSNKLHGLLVDIDNIEEQCDKIYAESVRKLYSGSNDIMEIIKWRSVYDQLEKCCDACEHASNVIESVIMKNS
ncbi:MAG TPA: DUF47 domain-containing protein [Clostridiales bacterium]|nr:DUF47 domain-containing protein [Clostridiales bacterium]